MSFALRLRTAWKDALKTYKTVSKLLRLAKGGRCG
jgi:hypothetical protein